MEEYNEDIRSAILKDRFEIWKSFLRDLEKSVEKDHSVVRFPNSSTYIFSTGSRTFWMMDPAFSGSGESLEEVQQIAELIRQKISFIVITHLHGDHCQFELVKMLADSSIQWVIPRDCAERFKCKSKIADGNIIALADGDTVELSGIRITGRHGYHYDPDKTVQTPSAAYEITLPDGIRLYFPADVRNYQAPPPDNEPVDYTFGHVFLGREDARGNNFSLLDDFCRFMLHKKSGSLILAHLYEIGRQPQDLWTCRHAAMIEERMRSLAPEMKILVPNFGDAVHLLKDHTLFRDPFLNWDKREQEDFFSSFGISIKMDHEEWMERAIAERIPVIEWLPGLALKLERSRRMDQLLRWRKNGGKCLSVHFPNFPLKGGEESWNAAIALALECGADRITVHVPNVPLKDMADCFEETAGRIAEFCRPLLDAGIRIGIENLHMKPYYAPDMSRPFGFIPPECVRLVTHLRETCSSELWGVHLDIGHAYSNPPWHERYDTEAWIRECGTLLNGMHIHQFEHQRTEEQPFLEGHGNICGRNTGHPSLLPLFEAWRDNRVRVPMILEVMRGVEPDPFASLLRLKRKNVQAE